MEVIEYKKKTCSFVDVDIIFTGRVRENCFVHCCMVVIPDTLFYQFNVVIRKSFVCGQFIA